jgi:serine/threonine-protein kinase
MSHAHPPGFVPVREGDVLAGKYIVERVIGVGGMGVVVAARHQLLGGRVALKFVLPTLVHGEAAVQRFLREAQAATLITSEHVARVTDVGVLDHGAPYMVMELLDGKDLGSVLAERGPLPVGEVVDYVLQALQAVAEAHAKGIVHRDLKPSNLFLTRRADRSALVKVLDFGIAKATLTDASGASSDKSLTATQGMLGSPLYMSPEQIRSPKHVDARSDVWAIGIVLHELLSANYPFNGESAPALLAAIAADAPVPLRRHRPDAPAAIEELILGCLEKNRDARVPSVATVAERLAAFGTDDARLSLVRIRGVSGYPSIPPAESGSAAAARSAGARGTGAGWGGTVGHKSTTSTSPRTALALAAVGGLLVLAAGGWVALRPSSAPAPLAETSSVSIPAPPPVSVAAPTIPTLEPVAPAVVPLPPPSASSFQAAPSAASMRAARPAPPPAVTTAKRAPAAAKSVVGARPLAKKGDDVDALIGERR